jgi:hypothetical protein
MIFKERPPSLGRRLAMAQHVLGDSWLGDFDPEFEPLAVDTWSAPKGIVTTQHSNQITNLLRHRRAPKLSTPDFPSPEKTKPFAMPGNHRGWFHDRQGGFPVHPDTP